MSDPSLALQKMVYGTLSAAAPVTALVPATAILDKNARPEAFPSIIIGDGQAIFADNYNSFHDQAFLNIHVWVHEVGLTGAKVIAGAVKDALRNGPWEIDGYRAINVRSVNARYMRDDQGQHSHAVVSIAAIMMEDDTAAADGTPSQSPSFYYLGF